MHDLHKYWKHTQKKISGKMDCKRHVHHAIKLTRRKMSMKICADIQAHTFPQTDIKWNLK